MENVSRLQGISLRNNKKIKVFLSFLLLSTAVWFLMELSKPYTNSVIFKVQYTDLPTEKILQNNPETSVNVLLKASGFSLLKYKLIPPKLKIRLNNINTTNRSSFVLPNNQITYLNSQINYRGEILKVQKDTIFIILGKNISKKVPVNPNIDIQFKIGYNLTEKLHILPDSVTISGPEKFVDSIEEITTKPVKLSEIYKNIDEELKLTLPSKNTKIAVSENAVRIKAEVDKFTEGKFKIPVVVINEPEGIKINPFPKEIEIIFQTGLSHYNQITENEFEIYFDYNQLNEEPQLQYLTPEIKVKSKWVSSYRINPARIEFLIQK